MINWNEAAQNQIDRMGPAEIQPYLDRYNEDWFLESNKVDAEDQAFQDWLFEQVRAEIESNNWDNDVPCELIGT